MVSCESAVQGRACHAPMVAFRFGRTASAFLVLVSTACESNPAVRGETVVDGSDDSAGSWSPVCPESPPAAGSSCDAPLGTACEYGEAWWDISCDTVVACDSSGWTAMDPGTGTCTPKPGPNPASCPPSVVTVPTACADSGLTCYYGTAFCTCSITGLPYPPADAGSEWNCGPGPAGCPTVRPRLGAPCASASQLCNVGAGLFGEQCENGVWQVALGGP